MGIFDIFKQHKVDVGSTATAVKDKAQDMVGAAGGMTSGATGQAANGLDKAGQLLNDKSGNRFSDQIDSGVAKAKDMLGSKAGPSDAGPDTPDPAQSPSPSEPPPQS